MQARPGKKAPDGEKSEIETNRVYRHRAEHKELIYVELGDPCGGEQGLGGCHGGEKVRGVIATPALMDLRQRLRFDENIHVFDVAVHIVGSLECVSIRYEVDADKDRQEEDDKRVDRERRVDQARENEIEDDDDEQAHQSKVEGVLQVSRAYIKAEEENVVVAVVARLDFEGVSPRHGELGDVEVGSAIVVAQASGYDFGKQVFAIEPSVLLAVDRSDMNDVLAECVVFELGPMEERALGIAVAFGAVGVGDLKFAFEGKERVLQGEVVNTYG